jgi:ABC-type phosphate/phosphonate transport system substrate-binding protein
MNKLTTAIALLIACPLGFSSLSAEDAESTLSLVVMDPLAAPLSCPCVEGYAQRKYEVLAEHLESTLGRDVKLTFGESLQAARKKAGGRADIVIGKQSVVLADAKAAEFDVTAISRLTDQQGLTTQFGMIVVNRDDPAASLKDLTEYSIIFGPEEAEEKSSAALQLLSDAGISIPRDRHKIDAACSDGACKVIDLGPTSKTAAVISSYAQPLLEGCGTIKKGDLRVVAQTAAVPFVTVFVTDTLDNDARQQLQTALADVALQPEILEALESLVGFLTIDESITVAKKN